MHKREKADRRSARVWFEGWVQRTMTEEEKRLVLVREPYCKKKFNVSFGTYADDLQRLGLADTSAHAAQRLTEWDEVLEQHVAPSGLAQNRSKQKQKSGSFLW